MIHFSWSFKLLRWPTIPFVALGLVAATTLPGFNGSAQAQDSDLNYGACAEDLVAAGIDPDTAAAACALAFEPTLVSNCVTDVVATTAIAPEVALGACSRDRRPDEVATCVTDIHSELAIDNSLTVLDFCHLSILPLRYKACVVGIAGELALGTDETLTRCIAAGYRPLNVAPTFIPTE